MSRRHLEFECADKRLIGTLDEAAGTCGLLWVGGGSEIRSGAFAGQAQLAARIAHAGYPVFRFDQRGVGDSEGENLGFRASGPDLGAALAAFRATASHVTFVVAFGNCDAASALMLNVGAGCDALVLANPWTTDGDEEPNTALPPAAVRARYAAKLRNPHEWLRLARGGVSLGKLAGGLAQAAGPAPAPSTLAQQMKLGLSGFSGPVRILLADRDRTAQAFAAAWDTDDKRIVRCPGAGHAFVEPDAREWLLGQLLAALEDEQAGQLDMG
jgi:exosortase A-associated hydrolase 1